MNTGRIIAYGSASIGVLLLLLFVLTKNDDFAFAGFFYLYIAAPINALYVIYLVVRTFLSKDPQERKDNGITILIMLGNIPLAYICAIFGLYLMEL